MWLQDKLAAYKNCVQYELQCIVLIRRYPSKVERERERERERGRRHNFPAVQGRVLIDEPGSGIVLIVKCCIVLKTHYNNLHKHNTGKRRITTDHIYDGGPTSL